MAVRGRKRFKRPEAPEVSLNITSLMDVLTVLLFFLLKSMSQSATEMSTPKNIRLPAGLSQETAANAVTVALSTEEVRVNDKVVMNLRNSKFSFTDFDLDKRTLTPLRETLEKEMAKRNAVYQGVGDLSFLPEAKVLIQADKSLPFALVKHVLHTVAIAGYSSYQFVITPKAE